MFTTKQEPLLKGLRNTAGFFCCCYKDNEVIMFNFSDFVLKCYYIYVI